MHLYDWARPVLFAMDAEQAHEWTLALIGHPIGQAGVRWLAGPAVADPVELLGLQFRNRVGLAAGLDKNAGHVDALAHMGFGFIEVGTVTPLPQPGNPRPRIFRLPEAAALINRLGFNNLGLDAFIENVRRQRYDGVLGLNIGKNAATPIDRAVDDYLRGLRRVWPFASYVTLNVSSPNTRDLRQLQGSNELAHLLGVLNTERAQLRREHRRDVPLLLKIAPDLEDAQIEAMVRVLVDYSIDGVIATNTTLARDAVRGLRHGDEAGGLSGGPVHQASLRVIRALRQLLPPRFPIIGVGGVMSAQHALEKRAAGADLVQLYTGLIYQGPRLVAECAAALRDAQAAPAP
jgi:dihydroorotate dehydrogenase